MLIVPTRMATANDGPPTFEPPIDLIASEDFAPREIGYSGPDWIQLGSGEWLQGELDRIRDGTLEFDSDELDDLKFDIDDVYAVVTGRSQTALFEGRVVVSGPVAIRCETIQIRSSSGIQTFTRRNLVGMVAGKPRESNYWSGSISVGLSLQKGNTNQTDLSTLANVMRETALTRSTAKYNGNLGSVSGTNTANNHRVNTKGDVFLSRRFYITLLSFEYFTDTFQNVDYRLTPAAGIGYTVVDRNRATLDIELAAGAQYTKDATPAFPGADQDKTTASIIMSTSFETDPTEDVEWDGELQIQLGVPDTAETNYHAITTLSIDVWGDFDFDLTFVWDRNQSPALRPDPTSPFGVSRPLQNDYRLTAGLGWDF